MTCTLYTHERLFYCVDVMRNQAGKTLHDKSTVYRHVREKTEVSICIVSAKYSAACSSMAGKFANSA